MFSSRVTLVSKYVQKFGFISFSTYFETKVNLEENKWTGNIFIPYSSIGLNKNSKLNNIKFNVGRNYHPLKEDYGLYSFAICPDLVLYEKEYFADGKVNKINLSDFTVTEPLEIKAPEKCYVGENEFTVNVDKDFQIIDIQTGKVYNSTNKTVKLNLDKEPKTLYAIIKEKECVLASSNIINVKTEDFISYDIIYPYYKAIVQSKDPNKTFKATVNIDRGDFDKYTLSYAIKADNKTFKGDTITIFPYEKEKITFGIGDLKPNEYVCEWVCMAPDGKVIDKVEYPFEVLKEADFEVTFDEKHLCYLNGEPFFPIGLYHANGREIQMRNPDKQLPTEVEALIDVKSKGFNFAHSLRYIEPVSWKDYYNNGLVFCGEVGRTIDKEIMDNIISESIKQKTNILYYTYDEPYGNLINEAREAYKYINSKDKHRPITAAVNTDSVFYEANDVFDIFMPDVYICGGDSLAYMVNVMNVAKNACHNKKPLWFVPQAFGWGYEGAPFKIPTKEELRCQAYLCLANGVTGLFWYAYTSGEEDKTTPYGVWYLPYSELWDAFGPLNKEVSEFVPILYKGISQGPLKTGNDKIYSNVWKVGDKRYAILVNAYKSEEVAELDFTPNFKPYFEGYNYNIEGNKITFAPYECIIVEY